MHTLDPCDFALPTAGHPGLWQNEHMDRIVLVQPPEFLPLDALELHFRACVQCSCLEPYQGFAEEWCRKTRNTECTFEDPTTYTCKNNFCMMQDDSMLALILPYVALHALDGYTWCKSDHWTTEPDCPFWEDCGSSQYRMEQGACCTTQATFSH